MIPHRTRPSHRSGWKRALLAVALAGLFGAVVFASQGAGAAGTELTLPLGNATAAEGTDCPASGGPYWHFVISPNGGGSYFITFHLNLGDATTYDTSIFVPNGDQLDNVFVAVPSGKQLSSIVKNGSSADVVWDGTGPTPEKFQLSHLCSAPGADDPDLTVAKTVSASYTRAFDWTIAKTADTSTVYSAGGGESGSVAYTVAVSKDAGTDSDWAISGTITVTNPNPVAVSGVQLTDTTPGGTCTVTPASVDVPANGTATTTYTCTFAANPGSGTNTVTATWPDFGSPTTSAESTAAYSFGAPTTLVDDEIDVTDTNGGAWHFSASGSETYTMTYTDPAGTCTTHTNTATITQTGETSSAAVEDCQGADLTVTKTAPLSYDLTYGWAITKSVTPASATVDQGYPATFAYTVVVSHDTGTESNWQVNGEIAVANPNDWQDVTADVTDALPGGSCTVTGGTKVTIPASGSVTLSYGCTFSGNPGAATNTATATWDATAHHTPNGTASGTATVTSDGPSNVYDECVSLTDTVAGSLGTVCTGDANPKTITYTWPYNGPAAGTCATHPNTVTATTDDTGKTGSASATVEVCSYKARFTPGYWKNHLLADPKNPANPWTAKYLPQSLGNYTVDTTVKATAVWNTMNCTNTGDQNAIGCLAGHLLAAKLNVANGANTCIAPTIALADSFLKQITYIGPSGKYTTLSPTDRTTAISLKSLLDAYNNGAGCH